MARSFKIISIAVLALGLCLAGCQKKVVKQEPVPETPPPAVQPEPTPPPPDDSFKPIDIDAQLREVLQTIYFEFDRYDLTSDAISKLERVASFLKDHGTVRVLAEGHCDERGSNEYNMGLGENRARAVKNYLTSYGISADRVETTSYGEERLARSACGTDDGCHALNRRVEWQVLAK